MSGYARSVCQVISDCLGRSKDGEIHYIRTPIEEYVFYLIMIEILPPSKNRIPDYVDIPRA